MDYPSLQKPVLKMFISFTAFRGYANVKGTFNFIIGNIKMLLLET